MAGVKQRAGLDLSRAQPNQSTGHGQLISSLQSVSKLYVGAFGDAVGVCRRSLVLRKDIFGQDSDANIRQGTARVLSIVAADISPFKRVGKTVDLHVRIRTLLFVGKVPANGRAKLKIGTWKPAIHS